jgi:hypothetical protein
MITIQTDYRISISWTNRSGFADFAPSSLGGYIGSNHSFLGSEKARKFQIPP